MAQDRGSTSREIHRRRRRSERYAIGSPALLIVLNPLLNIGYGESSKPPGSDSHVEYSKREMAADQVAVM